MLPAKYVILILVAIACGAAFTFLDTTTTTTTTSTKTPSSTSKASEQQPQAADGDILRPVAAPWVDSISDKEKQQRSNPNPKDDQHLATPPMSIKKQQAANVDISNIGDAGTFGVVSTSKDTAINHESNNWVLQDPKGPALLKKRKLASPQEVKRHLRNVVLMHMVSPTRYGMVPLYYKHYAPYVGYQIFTGPKNDTIKGEVEVVDEADGGDVDVDASGTRASKKRKVTKTFEIEGYDVVKGTMQYVALASVIDQLATSAAYRRRHGIASFASIDGFLFVGDDLVLQPWMLAGRNLKLPWCAGMGIANAHNWRPVKPVPSMSVEGRFLKANWPFWFQGRVKMLKVLDDPEIEAETPASTTAVDGIAPARENLARAAELTPRNVHAWSKYVDPAREFCCAKKYTGYHIFYTIVDVFFVPRHLVRRWAKYAWLARKNWLHLETAIPSTLRMVSPMYEALQLQYYWSSVSATKCKRTRWAVSLDGFHRCRHDHAFVQRVFAMSHAERVDLMTAKNRSQLHALKNLDGLDRSWAPPGTYSTDEYDDRMKKK